jgi:membrane fusion protein, multidrug efflux system
MLRYFSLSIGFLVLILVGCGKKGIPSAGVGTTTAVSKVNLKRPVELTKTQQRIIVSTVEQVGALEAKQTTDIAAGVSGIVEEVLFEEGQIVDPSEKKPLIRIDQEKYQRAFEALEATEKRNQAMFERAKDASKRAAGTVGFSDAERRQTEETMNAAQADIFVAQANLKLAKHNLDRSRVPPPYRGQMNQKKITPGSYVKEETIIGTIADLSEIRVVGFVPETVAPIIRERMDQRPKVLAARSIAALLAGADGGWGGITTRMLSESNQIPSGYDIEFSVPSLPKRMFRGTIFYMSTIADPTTHMFECKARIDATDPNFASLKPGFTARIRFPYESTADAVVVPEESVRATERGFLVFIVEKRQTKDGQTEWVAKSRRVEPGARSPGWVEVRAGLAPGQWVVQRGAEALDDGVPVRIPEEQVKMLETK